MWDAAECLKSIHRYHLTRSEVKCLLCGVKKAVHDVLRKDLAGAHIILITR